MAPDDASVPHLVVVSRLMSSQQSGESLEAGEDGMPGTRYCLPVQIFETCFTTC